MTATITSDFADRTRQRVAQSRTLLLKLLEANKAVVGDLKKIYKQQSADADRVSTRLSKLAEDLALPEPEGDEKALRAWDAAFDRVYAQQEAINILAGQVEELNLGSFDDLWDNLRSPIVDDALAGLKQTEGELAVLLKSAGKLGI